MKQTRLNKLLATSVTLALTLQGILPFVALATERTVELENHTMQTDQTMVLRDITIDGVDRPTAGIELDQNAVVVAENGANWEIPVMWVRDDLQIDSGVADEVRTYLPVLAFYVPQDYALAEDVFAVTLSDSLSKLFETHEIISVYDAATNITYILPASLRDLFVKARREEASPQPAIEEMAAQTETAIAQADLPVAAPERHATSDMAHEVGNDMAHVVGNDMAHVVGNERSLVDIHCAQTARDALSDEDLEWLVELIIDHLEPQAVNLLLDKFPAFDAAAMFGEIGEEISLYVFYRTGDNDGAEEHGDTDDTLAYVTARAKEIEGELKYCYMLAVNVDSLLKKNDDGNPIQNPSDGKCSIIREGQAMETFQNTIVRELFQTLMYDYNRAGMAGATNLDDLRTDAKGDLISEEAEKRYLALRFPSWFIEGSASAVEQVYTYRNQAFQDLRRLQGDDGRFGTGELNSTYTTALLIDTYVGGYFNDGRFMYNDIGFSEGGKDSDGGTIDTERSNYVTGYLATLYLCELASRYAYNNESSVKVVDGVTTVDSNRLRGGLDNLLKWMHEGNTLDSLIATISPNDSNGKPLYKDAASFEDLFIKGEQESDGMYRGDSESLSFVTTLLNYLLYLDNNLPEGEHPTGSILEDFSKRYTTPLDQNKQDSSDYLKIIDSNELIPSTVKSDTAGIGGGKSNPDTLGVRTADSSNEQSGQQGILLPEATTTGTQAEAAHDLEDEVEPASEPGTEPAPAIEVGAQPEPVAQPEPTPAPVTEVEAQPEPVSQPEPTPAPVTEVEAQPDPAQAEPEA
ncbi:MAG: hypothetical protein IJI12_02080 [Atopobiaceae bacterium]|nr:hypothetical protein [Atopobiaceae bacterium]